MLKFLLSNIFWLHQLPPHFPIPQNSKTPQMIGYLYFLWFLSSSSLWNPLQSGFCIPVLHENSFCQGHQWPWPSKCSIQWSVLVPHLTGTLSSFWQNRWCHPLWNPVKTGVQDTTLGLFYPSICSSSVYFAAAKAQCLDLVCICRPSCHLVSWLHIPSPCWQLPST